MFFLLKRRLLATLAMTCLLLGSSIAHAYPSRTITIIVPFSAGGGVDAMARLLAESMGPILDENIIVQNRPGASGMLGANYVANAKPDGYTLLLGSAGETSINTYVYKNSMNYSPEDDLAPITLVTRVPNVLIAGPSLEVDDVAGLVRYAKENPGMVTYATSGVGNPQHLNGELLASVAGISLMDIPYKGASGQMADVAGGNVDMTFVSYAAASSFIQGGRVKALAVTSAERASFAPDIPALAETEELSSYSLENWFGLFAPAGTPQDIIELVNKAATQSLKDPKLMQRLLDQGGVPAPMSPQEFADFIKQESGQYKTIIDEAGITVEN